MKANFGKTKRICVLTVTGNRNGLAGFAIGKAKDARTALKKSKNKAGQRLRYIELDSGHTVLHDFYSRFGFTKVYVRKMPKGYGLVAHRCVRGICETLGITDIHCKVEGSEKNYLNLTRAFFLGLIHQKSFQQMADEKGLHVVEFREDTDNYPVVRASPSGRCRTDEEIGSDEILDFHMYLHDGKVRAQTIKKAGVLYTTSSLADIPEKVALLSQQRSDESQSDCQISIVLLLSEKIKESPLKERL
jgi:small subunit ribosomal protein S5